MFTHCTDPAASGLAAGKTFHNPEYESTDDASYATFHTHNTVYTPTFVGINRHTAELMLVHRTLTVQSKFSVTTKR